MPMGLRPTSATAAMGAALALLCFMAGNARATVSAGDVAPNFTKNELAPGPAVGAPRSLSEFAGKVVLLILAGYNCPFCINNAPSVQANLWQYYQANHPGQVQVLSADVWNGTPAQLQSFRNTTGVTYPLLLNATLEPGGNLYDLYYPDTDDYIVINKQGIVRYHAADLHGHGQRYVLSELRGCMDSLVTATVDVGEPALPRLALSVSPNPFSSRTAVEFANPARSALQALVTVHDLAGRRVATLWNAAAPPGSTRLEWTGQLDGGRLASAGVYLVRAELAGTATVRRVVRLR
jgi:peroxiredoxin